MNTETIAELVFGVVAALLGYSSARWDMNRRLFAEYRRGYQDALEDVARSMGVHFEIRLPQEDAAGEE